MELTWNIPQKFGNENDDNVKKKTISLKEYYYDCLSIQLRYMCDDVPLYCIRFFDLSASSFFVCFLWYTIHMEIHSLLVKKRNRSSFFGNVIFYDPFINFIWWTLLSSFLFSFDLFLNVFFRCFSFFPFNIQPCHAVPYYNDVYIHYYSPMFLYYSFF